MTMRDEAARAADVYGVAAGGAAGTPNELEGAFALAWFVQLARFGIGSHLLTVVGAGLEGLKVKS